MSRLVTLAFKDTIFQPTACRISSQRLPTVATSRPSFVLCRRCVTLAAWSAVSQNDAL
jgi:hypothetical protein